MQPPNPTNRIAIVVAVISALGVITAAVITRNSTIQVSIVSATSEALVGQVTQEAATKEALQGTVNAPTDTPYPTQTLQSTFTPYPTFTSLPTYTPIPVTSTPTIQLPFSDNFDNGLSDLWDLRRGTWRVVNSQLTVDEKSGIILIGDKNWTDYTVDVDFFTYDHNFPVGIIVRENNGNYLYFKANCCDTVWILVNGPDEKVIAKTGERGLTYSGFSGFVKNHFQIVVSGKTFTAFIDGKLFVQVEDSTITNGRVGFILADGLDQRIDNLVISSP